MLDQRIVSVNNYRTIRLGELIYGKKPLLGIDGKLIAVVVEDRVVIYSTLSGEKTNILLFDYVREKYPDMYEKRHNKYQDMPVCDNIVAANFCSKNPQILRIFHVSGLMVFWDILDHSPIKAYLLPFMVSSAINDNTNRDVVYFLTPCTKKSKKSPGGKKTVSVAYRYDLTTGKAKKLFVTNEYTSFCTLTEDSKYLGTYSRSHIYIYDLWNNELKTIGHIYPVTTMGFSANGYFGYGNERGQIYICKIDDLKPSVDKWGKNIINMYKSYNTTLLHWHAHAVRSMEFLKGNKLLSGGEEGVLVVWDISTQEKDFLPRLGGTVAYITASISKDTYLLACTDNTIKVVTSDNRQIILEIRGFKRSLDEYKMDICGHYHPISATLDKQKIICAIDPSSNLVVNEYRPGSLQFYSYKMQIEIHTMDVEIQTHVSKKNQEIQRFNRIDFVKFSYDGELMVTSDYCHDSVDGLISMFVKIWMKTSPSKYECKAKIAFPHIDTLSDLQFDKLMDKYYILTSSFDGDIKEWELIIDRESDTPAISLYNTKIFNYKMLKPVSCSYSNDHTLLFGHFLGKMVECPPTNRLVIWDVANKSLIRQYDFNSCPLILTETELFKTATHNCFQCAVPNTPYIMIVSFNKANLFNFYSQELKALADGVENITAYGVHPCDPLVALGIYTKADGPMIMIQDLSTMDSPVFISIKEQAESLQFDYESNLIVFDKNTTYVICFEGILYRTTPYTHILERSIPKPTGAYEHYRSHLGGNLSNISKKGKYVQTSYKAVTYEDYESHLLPPPESLLFTQLDAMHLQDHRSVAKKILQGVFSLAN